jgi:hypothetical protein
MASPLRPDAPSDWSAEFQRRRRRAWRRTRWVMAAIVIAWLAGWFGAEKHPLLMPIAGGIFFLGVAWLILVMRTDYLCPACGQNPPGQGGDGVDLDPEFCSHCGVRLRPEPRHSRLA